MNLRFDVGIVGAGVAGSATALAFAAKGATVAVIDSAPDITRRVAGELIQPRGKHALDQLRVSVPGALPVLGFTMHPDDGSAPVSFDYGADLTGISAPYPSILGALHDALSEHEAIIVTHARARTLERGRITYDSPDGLQTLTAGRIVNAQGHAAPRSHLSDTPPSRVLKQRLSRMLAVTIRGTFDDSRGHVFTGLPGPIVAYNVAPDAIRAFVDVPLQFRGDVASAYRHLLPHDLAEPFVDAIRSGAAAWGTNFSQPRLRYFDSEGIAHVGDATGVLHPISACGISLALEDALALASSPSGGEYQRRRRRETHAVELITGADYELTRKGSIHDEVLRQGLYRMARAEPRQASAALSPMSRPDTGALPFLLPFTRIVISAIPNLAKRRALGRILQWVLWLATPRRSRPATPGTRLTAGRRPRTDQHDN